MWGHVFDRIAKAAKPTVVERWQKKARSSDTNNLHAALFEVFGPALFYHPKDRPIVDADDRLPGYDFSVDLGSSKVLQVSLKDLRPADYERKLRGFAEGLRDDLKRRLPASARPMLRVFVPETSSTQFLSSEREALVDAIIAALAASQHRVQVGPWSALIDELAPIDGNTFARTGPSFTLLLAAKHGPNENQRLSSNAIDVACGKFREHCSEVGSTIANVFMIKIPTSVNIEEARAAVQAAFASSANACVSAGYLYRASWLTRNGGASFYIGHEIYEEKNPLATVPLDAVCPKMSLAIPFGQVQVPVPVRELRVGDELHIVDGEHAVLLGSHVYEGRDIRLVARHGVELIHDDGRGRSVIYAGHDDRLILL